MNWKKTAVSTLAAALGVIAVGYASAWYSLTACGDAVFQDTQRREVVGIGFDLEEVRLSRDDISARIAGPFLVEVGYSLPRHIHGSIYTTRFAVFFGYLQQRSSDVLHLVGPPLRNGVRATS